jgi:hypothetical protein
MTSSNRLVTRGATTAAGRAGGAFRIGFGVVFAGLPVDL